MATELVGGVERPRDVYLATCRLIADGLLPNGFSYARSKQRLTRDGGWHKQHINFQSSHGNVPGEHVAMWVHVTATSRALGSWRKAAGVPGPADELIGGGQIGNLLAARTWIDWELANRSLRPKVIADVVATIAQIGQPFFDACVNIDGTLDRLMTVDVPGFDVWPERVIDLFMFKERPEDAGRYAKRFLSAIDKTTNDIAAAVRRQEVDSEAPRRDYVDEIAMRVRMYGLALP